MVVGMEVAATVVAAMVVEMEAVVMEVDGRWWR